MVYRIRDYIAGSLADGGTHSAVSSYHQAGFVPVNLPVSRSRTDAYLRYASQSRYAHISEICMSMSIFSENKLKT